MSPAPARPGLRLPQVGGYDEPIGRVRDLAGLLLALYGWKIEREMAIFVHGGSGAFVASAEMRWTTTFYLMSTSYATFAATSTPRAE